MAHRANSLLSSLVAERVASRIWRRDVAVFLPSTAGEADRTAVTNRLGWLDAPAEAGNHVAGLVDFAEGLRRDALTRVYLLGMGGSSLCAEVLRDLSVGRPDSGGLVLLDTTDERTVRDATEELDARHAVFIVASKSGSTIEVTALEQHFWDVAHRRLAAAGQHFVAITDPGTPLETLAASRGYRQTFINRADIGGRYSALSLFGLVPAALLGWDLSALTESARGMAERCRPDDPSNPGIRLGAFMASLAAEGRDKLTLLLPPSLAAFGAWVEQLVAESTGKQGRGVLPIVGEPLGVVREYGPDRAFVAFLTGSRDGDIRKLADRLEQAGQPVFRIETTPADLGAEFFRWEFATAVAGAALALNPFDEPNVRDAKARTQSQLEARRLRGVFRVDPPFERGDGYSRRESLPASVPPANLHRYLAILDYLPPDPRRAPMITAVRGAIRRSFGVATTHGVGPRYLHSTGQYHKGGPNTGRFVLLTAADTGATPVPGTDYTFSALKQAQALGDFDALAAAGREVVHYHLDDPRADFTATLERLLGRLAGSRA